MSHFSSFPLIFHASSVVGRKDLKDRVLDNRYTLRNANDETDESTVWFKMVMRLLQDGNEGSLSE